MFRLRIPFASLALALAACVPLPTGGGSVSPGLPGGAPAAGVPAAGTGAAGATPVTVKPLPGALDKTPVLQSNSPEVVVTDGILVSTLAGGGAHLDYKFDGAFEVFSHHLADDRAGDANALWLGLLARNDGDQAVTIQLKGGASWLSRPDAPFLTLAAIVEDATGKTFAGPGSRVATDLVHGRSPVAAASWTLAPGETRVLDTRALPTTNGGIPNRNERTTQLRFESNGPVRLAEVATFGRVDAAPTAAALQALLDAGTLAGPRDRLPTIYTPGSPPPSGAFVYGRAAGVATGATWTGTLFDQATTALPKAGDRYAVPIAALVQNTMGSKQIQAPDMARRYPDTAVQAQGSYGVAYDLRLPLDAPADAPATWALHFTSPLKVSESAPAPPRYLPPAGQRTTFRGPLKLTWTDAAGKAQVQAVHVVLHDGEDAPAFATVTVPAGQRFEARLALVYPADCTPPQLLTVVRR